uniref:Single-stranded DNA-binding protein n=1 Tax=Triatoma dimidiata TaxID=72491 RepID=A0A0V0GC89_TRIDM
MEKTLNQITLLGRVGGEPQKRGTTDHPVVIFSLATHTHYKYESGEATQKTDWHRISVFKPSLRDLVFSYLHKGQRVLVSGRITYGSIKEDGNIRPTTSIVADDIIFFHSGEN